MSHNGGAPTRILALLFKEALQLVRDRATLGMLLGIPILQIALFGYAIELSPQALAITVVTSDARKSERVERMLSRGGGLAEVQHEESLAVAKAALARGTTLLVVDADAWPRVVYLDATDPVLAAHAENIIDRFLRSMSAPLEDIDADPPPLRVERLYNPQARTQPYLVSGLLGVILTMSLVMMSALTIARERERGTLEGLLASSARPFELWAGKLAPYILIGAVQVAFVLLVARYAFDIRPVGSLSLLFGATLLFAVANLALGFLFSCLAAQQTQAMQMTFFFFLPSSLLSGFMFPFSAMPRWAQSIAEILPLTHYLRIVRGLVLRGVDTAFVQAELLPIALFAIVTASVSMLAWRRTIA